jgi:hypothetical protein
MAMKKSPRNRKTDFPDSVGARITARSFRGKNMQSPTQLRVISLWQPYASLLVHRHKLVETRPFPAPSTIIRQRIGIASTKQIKPEQRALFNDPLFQAYYSDTGLPAAFDDLPHGYLVGTVTVISSDVITEGDLEDVTDEEKLYGDWRVGRYAWRCQDHQALDKPIPCQGAQGIWIWTDDSAKKVRHLRAVD